MASLQLAGHLATSTPSTTLRGRHIGCASTMAVKGSNFYAALMNLSLEDEAAAAAKAVRSPSKAAAASSAAMGSRGKAAAVETAASSRFVMLALRSHITCLQICLTFNMHCCYSAPFAAMLLPQMTVCACTHVAQSSSRRRHHSSHRTDSSNSSSSRPI